MGQNARPGPDLLAEVVARLTRDGVATVETT